VSDLTLLEESVRTVFAENSPAQGSDPIGPLRNALDSAGFPWVGVPEAYGGSGGSLGEASAIWREEGRAASPVPLADVSLAGWLLAEADLIQEQGAWTVAPPRFGVHTAQADGRLHVDGTFAGVPNADNADVIVAVVESVPDGPAAEPELYVVAIDRSTVDVSVHENLAGESRDVVIAKSLSLAPDRFRPVPAMMADALLLRGALTRIQLASGAMDSAVACALEHASERSQFGRPIGSFQAVQHLAVRAAEHQVLADAAARAVSLSERPLALEIAAAKVVVSEAAGVVAATTHQICGAIGMTLEFPLHRWTRRLWAWRDEYGGSTYWKRRLGADVRRLSIDSLWELVTRDH
jgi:acyl-CoA dehydrogenase